MKPSSLPSSSLSGEFYQAPAAAPLRNPWELMSVRERLAMRHKLQLKGEDGLPPLSYDSQNHQWIAHTTGKDLILKRNPNAENWQYDISDVQKHAKEGSAGISPGFGLGGIEASKEGLKHEGPSLAPGAKIEGSYNYLKGSKESGTLNSDGSTNYQVRDSSFGSAGAEAHANTSGVGASAGATAAKEGITYGYSQPPAADKEGNVTVREWTGGAELAAGAQFGGDIGTKPELKAGPVSLSAGTESKSIEAPAQDYKELRLEQLKKEYSYNERDIEIFNERASSGEANGVEHYRNGHALEKRDKLKDEMWEVENGQIAKPRWLEERQESMTKEIDSSEKSLLIHQNHLRKAEEMGTPIGEGYAKQERENIANIEKDLAAKRGELNQLDQMEKGFHPKPGNIDYDKVLPRDQVCKEPPAGEQNFTPAKQPAEDGLPPWEKMRGDPVSTPATLSNQGVQASYSPANESPVMSPAAYSKLSGSESPTSVPMGGELGAHPPPPSIAMSGETGMPSTAMARRSEINSNPLNITDTEGSSIGAHLGLADDMKLGKPAPNGDGSYNYPILDSKGNPVGSFDIHRQDDGDLVLHGAHQSNHLQGSAGWDRPNASSGHSTGTGNEKDFNTGKTEKSDGGFDGAGASFGGKAEGSANAFEVQAYDMIIESDGSGLMNKITSSFGKGSASIKGGGNAGVDGKGKADANIGVQAGAEGKAAEGTLGGEKFFSMQVGPDGVCRQTTIGAEGGAFLGGAAKYTGSFGNQGFQSKGSLGLGAGLTGGGKFEYGKTEQCNNPFAQIGQPPAGSPGGSGSNSVFGDNPLPFGFSPDGLTPGPMSFGGSGMAGGGGQSIKAIEDEADDLAGQAEDHADDAESAARRARSAARRAASIAARIRAMTSRRYS